MKRLLGCLLTTACAWWLFSFALIPGESPNPVLATGETRAAGNSGTDTVVKKVAGHKEIQTDSCGMLREVLALEDKLPLTLVIADDIKPTKGHFHRNFKEIYLVVDGSLSLRFYDPATDRTWEEELTANELCVIDANIHHMVTKASPGNRLYVIAVPGYTDETLSDKL